MSDNTSANKNKNPKHVNTNNIYNDTGKWLSIINTTISNYSNMKTRLQQQNDFSNFILVYYSLFLILISITSLHFKTLFNLNIISYFNLVLSIFLLVYSLLNQQANCVIRIEKINNLITRLNAIKRNSNGTIDEIKTQYQEELRYIEPRHDIDFFNTIQQKIQQNHNTWIKFVFPFNLCKNKNIDCSEIKETIDHLQKVNWFSLIITSMIYQLWGGLLVVLPIIIVISGLVLYK